MTCPRSRSSFALSIALVVFALTSFVSSAFAQAGRGSISGLVSDQSGAIVPGAKVVAESQATGLKLSTVSTDAGLYSFVSLAPGIYRVTATAQGFDTLVANNIRVSVDQGTTANLSLKIGSVNEVVTVNDSTSLVEATNSTVGQLIGADTMDRVPLLTRNVFDLVQLSAGVTPANGTPNSSTSQQISSITSGRPGVDVSSYTINGAIIGSVYYMVDGSPLGIAENNAGAIIPALEMPEDGVEETRVETQNTPASYQSGGAGVISLVTKSGTNAFHGDAFGMFRPNILAANEYFNKRSGFATPDYHRYQEGGAIGGPIVKDKLFFFGDYEDTQQQQFDGSNWFTVPTSAERTGDFSADSFTIYNPMVPEVQDGDGNWVRQPFANNVISNPNPIAVEMLSHFPKCNWNPDTNEASDSCDSLTDGATRNLYVPGLDPLKAHKFDVRIDWVQSEKQRIYGRFSYDKLFFSLVNAFNSMWDPYYAQNATNGRNFILADDLTLSPTMVLQLRYSFTRHYENQGGDPRQNGFDITTLGFPASLAAEQVYKTLPLADFWDVGGGIGGTSNWNTFVYASENSDANVSLTKTLGKHELSAGFEYMKRFLNVGQPPASSGWYSFDTSATDKSIDSGEDGSDFASFLLGMGSVPGAESYNFTKDLFVAEANPYYAAFIEDTFHPSKSLTLTAGLRWDIFGGKTERHNRLEYFDPSASNTVGGVQYTGAEVYVGKGSRSPFDANLKDFGPRIGFAWQVVPKMVVRGGAGYYYGPSPHMVGGASQNSDGFASVSNWDSTCFTDGGNTTYNGTSLCADAAPGSPAPSTTGIYSLSNPFPNGVVGLIDSPSGLANNLGSTLYTMLRTQPTPTTYNFNFGFEYEFPHQVIFSAAYVGSRGLFLPLGSLDLNQLDLNTIASHGAALCVDNSNAACEMVPNQWASILPSTNSNYGAAEVPLWVSLQTYPQFGSGNYGGGNGVNVAGYPGGDSDYSSLQTKVQKRLTHHFTTLATFTWAKLMTDDGNPPLAFVGSHGGGPQNARNLGLEHSVSPQDVKYQFTGQASYDLPIGRGRAVNMGGVGNAILGGWTMNGIVYLSTGVPIASPTSGVEPSYFNQRADMTCDPSKGALHTSDEWFKMDCFSIPSSPFIPGTAPAYLDHVRTAGARDVDLSVYKHFTFGREKDLRFEISSYNVGNYAQLGMPNVPNLTIPTDWGLIGNTINSPRQFQFGSRFTF